jgi:fimbrial chaperone protein
MNPTLSRAFLAVMFAAALLASTAARGAAFGVSPIRVDLDASSRSGLITVTNDEDRRLRFQVKLRRWTQDAGGIDQYADSDDLLYFPQILTLEPKEKRVVRIGLRSTPVAPEAAYRLYVEEMPDATAAQAQGAQVSIRLRFGVPVFVTGAKGEPRTELTAVGMRKGRIELGVRNNGERHVRIEEIVARSSGHEIGKVAGWYVFPGASRPFSIPVAREACPSTGTIEIVAITDGREARTVAEPASVLCAP